MSLWRTLRRTSGNLVRTNQIDFWQITLTTQDPQVPNLPLEQAATATGAGAATLANATLAGTGLVTAAVRPEVMAYNNANTTLSTGTSLVAVNLNSEVYDTGNMHSVVSDTSRLTTPQPGFYLVSARARFAANATGYRTLAIRQGASQLRGARLIAPQGDASLGISTGVGALCYAAAGDYFEMLAQQNSGGNLNLEYTSGETPYFGMTKLSTSTYVIAYNSAAQLITTGGIWYYCTLDSELYDTDGMHSNVTNNSRLTVQVAGRYLFFGQVQWAAAATGWRGINIRVNGDDEQISGGTTSRPQTNVAEPMQVTTVLNMGVSDYVQLGARHIIGSDTNIEAVSGFSTVFAGVMLPPGLI